MSYTSENTFPDTVRAEDVRELVELLGYERVSSREFKIDNQIASYVWFDRKDYRSWTGIELGIYRDPEAGLVVSTRTRSSRSYWDLEHQNKTIRLLRRLFGGSFTTDAGKNRCTNATGGPIPPMRSGCYLAIWNFDSNLMRAHIYMDQRQFTGNRDDKVTSIWWIDTLNPRIISNNLLIPFIVSTMEDYFKSTYITLLRYSDRRDAALRASRLAPQQHAAVGNGLTSIEEAIVEGLPFQRPSAFLSHFSSLDPKLDLMGTLRRPYRRRKEALADSLEQLVELRHDLIHRSIVAGDLDDKRIKRAISDVTAAVRRCYERICTHFGWPIELPLGFEMRSDA